MTKTKKSATAASKSVPETTKGVTLTRLTQDGVSSPCALYRGSAPAKGDKIKFKLANGITYAGIVADATEADGEVLVEFKNGIQPQK